MGTRLVSEKGEHNPGVWFKFDESDPDSGSICVRMCTPKKTKEIQKVTTKTKTEYRNGQRYTFTETDEDANSRLLWDYIIADWSGLEDNNGELIPCTAENKFSYMMENLRFFKFVMQCVSKLSDELSLERERVEGN